MTNIEFARALQRLADIYADNPDKPQPSWRQFFIEEISGREQVMADVLNLVTNKKEEVAT